MQGSLYWIQKTQIMRVSIRLPLILGSFAFGIFCCTSCLNTQGTTENSAAKKAQPAPFSDPTNAGGWVLNQQISDEFEGTILDPDKWFVEGQNDEYYIWKGRAPSQFAAHNVIVEDGKLKLRTQWEPDFAFADESYADGNNNDAYGRFDGKALPITTAGVVTKKRFLNGYLEVKSKTGNAAITGAFWAIGYEQELDVYEQMGRPKDKNGDIQERGTKATIHDWSPPATRPTWTWKYKDNHLPFRTADAFHVYGADWGVDYLKVYIDGQLVDEVNQDELGTEWVLNNPMEVWLDSEIFKWLGLPHKEELPVDFEIEYLRVWQKPNDNLLARQFYGFEGPILYEDQPRPLDLLPESSVPDDYQKFWIIDSASSRYLVINEGQYASGVNSLEFSGFGKGEKLEIERVVALSPSGAVDLPAGDLVVSLMVYLEQGHLTRKIYLLLEDEGIEIPIRLEGRERRRWLRIEERFSKLSASSPDDRFSVEIRQEDVPHDRPGKFYIDDISIRRASSF